MLTISIIERKQREQAQMKENILSAARSIITHEGVENVSIRKIAAMIEYSPAIIYHYFKNKDEIIEKLIAEDYTKILESLSSLKDCDMTLEDKVRETIRKFIMMAVKMGDSYKFMMINDSPHVLDHTSVLKKGASVNLPSISMLCSFLKQFPNISKCSDEEVELTAQIIWSMIFGLTMRIIVEHIDEKQQQKLMDHTAELVLYLLNTIK